MSDTTETTGSVRKDDSINMEEVLSKAGKKDTNIELENSKHGDIIEFEDGSSGIVIDKQEQLNKIAKAASNEKLDKLVDESSPIYGDIVKNTSGVDPNRDYGMKVVNADPDSDDAQQIMTVKQAFAGLAPGLEGLVPENSPEAREFSNAFKELQEGKYVLPSVSEYEKQKEAVRKRKQEEAQKIMESQNNQTQEAVQVKRYRISAKRTISLHASFLRSLYASGSSLTNVPLVEFRSSI